MKTQILPEFMIKSPRDLQLLFATFVQFLKGAHQFSLNNPNFLALGDPNIPITLLLLHLHRVQGIMAIKIIDLALLGVAENIISLWDLLELGLGFFFRNRVVLMVLVWVPLHGQPLICPLEFFIRGIAVHLQDLVVVPCTHLGPKFSRIMSQKSLLFFFFFSRYRVEKSYVFPCVGKEKERVGFDSVHVAAKGVLWVTPITPNILVLAAKGWKCTGEKAAKITFNVQK